MSKIYDKLKLILEKIDCVYFDTSSLLDIVIDRFLYIYNEVVEETSNRIYSYIHIKVKEELHKHLNNPEITNAAKKALKLIDLYTQNGLFTSTGAVYENFGDNAIYTSIGFDRINKRVLLITEDGGLKKNCVSLNNLQSQKGFPVVSFDVHSLMANDFYIGLSPQSIGLDESLLGVNYVPKSGDYVTTSSGKTIQLGAQIGKTGGEGSCYHIGNNKICKIYIESKLTNFRENKIKYMINNQINKKNIAWPLDYVQYNGKFVGFIMNSYLDCEPMIKIASDRTDTIKFIPTREKMLKVILNLLDIIRTLHIRYIIIGDISLNNFLFKGTDVYMIDVDSVQIERYYCPMHTDDYVAPEHISNSYNAIRIGYRTEQSEVFNVARLIFKLLIGVDPYDSTKNTGFNTFEFIKKGKFPYQVGRTGSQDVPKDNSELYWSYLNNKLQKNFFDSFSFNGNRFKDGNRLSAHDWYKIINTYLNDVSKSTDDRLKQLFIVKTPTPKVKSENKKIVEKKDKQNLYYFDKYKKFFKELLDAFRDNHKFIYVTFEKEILKSYNDHINNLKLVSNEEICKKAVEDFKRELSKYSSNNTPKKPQENNQKVRISQKQNSTVASYQIKLKNIYDEFKTKHPEIYRKNKDSIDASFNARYDRIKNNGNDENEECLNSFSKKLGKYVISINMENKYKPRFIKILKDFKAKYPKVFSENEEAIMNSYNSRLEAIPRKDEKQNEKSIKGFNNKLLSFVCENQSAQKTKKQKKVSWELAGKGKSLRLFFALENAIDDSGLYIDEFRDLDELCERLKVNGPNNPLFFEDEYNNKIKIQFDGLINKTVLIYEEE